MMDEADRPEMSAAHRACFCSQMFCCWVQEHSTYSTRANTLTRAPAGSVHLGFSHTAPPAASFAQGYEGRGCRNFCFGSRAALLVNMSTSSFSTCSPAVPAVHLFMLSLRCYAVMAENGRFLHSDMK